MFDTRNTRLHTFDNGLLADYDNKLKAENKENNLIIFHLIGSHVSYNRRYPKSRKHFKAADYEQKRPELTKQRRYMLAHYDNAILYNDSIVDQIVKRFANEEAVVIYMPTTAKSVLKATEALYAATTLPRLITTWHATSLQSHFGYTARQNILKSTRRCLNK